MTPDDITTALQTRFGQDVAQRVSDDAWQVETDDVRLLAIRPGAWLKLMIPLMQVAEAQPFITQMMAANFDETQEARYAFHQGVVWVVFQYDMAALELPQFESAVDCLLALKTDGVDIFFNRMVEAQLTQIILASKQQGQTLESTMKTLDRFYAEGMMGDMGSAANSNYQQQALGAWRRQLERLWPTIQVDEHE
ncbi:MAG: hypothetical protein AAF703_16205 [Cyanobacteria bacterium P01_D01_bin.105]